MASNIKDTLILDLLQFLLMLGVQLEPKGLLGQAWLKVEDPQGKYQELRPRPTVQAGTAEETVNALEARQNLEGWVLEGSMGLGL
ncbi:uncharacterized protein BDV14DRAFT_206497 [Aspergillus stella-maris]|uniref:uncharacterized protein n=1 Tax=Aspergillus stella-maris TaxID=1810926 RepID=UPI003CCDE380